MNFLYYLSLIFYQISIKVFYVAARISAIWNPKHKLWIDGRKNILQRIASTLLPGEKRIWIHC